MLKPFLKVALLLSVVTLFLSTQSFNAVAAKANSASWKAFQNRFSPNMGTSTITFPGGKFLNSVATVSAHDVWAVGNYIDVTPVGFLSRTLIEHWNGTQWSLVTSPNPGPVSNSLAAVAVVSANDVWAVGSGSNTINTALTLIEHWNGSSWSAVPSPNPAGWDYNALGGIAAISANDIWAVGYSSKSDNSEQTLIEHWNGSQWSLVSSPNPGSFQNGLNGVAAGTANNVWAVGSSSNNSNSGQTLVEHWNGSQWSVVASPNPSGSAINTLNDVAVVSPNNIWAVGSSNTFSLTLIEHWNGTKWSIVTSPSPGQISVLNGIAAVTANDIWAVGQSLAVPNGQTLIEHWNGSQWSIVTSPNQPGSVNNFLSGIAAISANNIWTVGGYQSSNLAGFTLIEQWNGTQWSLVSSPNTETSSAEHPWKLTPVFMGHRNWIMAN